jgi:hypothetical protein
MNPPFDNTDARYLDDETWLDAYDDHDDATNEKAETAHLDGLGIDWTDLEHRPRREARLLGDDPALFEDDDDEEIAA